MTSGTDDPGHPPGLPGLDGLFDPDDDTPAPPRPINWDELDGDDLHRAWHDLNDWVEWLRHTYGLPATVIPPYWHRHPELHQELSALHLHWQSANHPDQHASAPHGWHRDLTDAIARLRDWTAAAGAGLTQDRPTRQTQWPGDPPPINTHHPPIDLTNRHRDFTQHVEWDVARRTNRGGSSHGVQR